MTKAQAHEYNLDAAYQAMESRDAQGEDMSDYYVDEKTYEIKKGQNEMKNIIWTNGRWEIDADGVIWLNSDVTLRNVSIPNRIFNKRDSLMAVQS